MNIFKGMADGNLYGIKELIQQMLKDSGIQHKMHEDYIIKNWDQIAGKTIAKYTGEIKLYKDVLQITIKAAPLRQEIFYNREKLINLVNEALKERVVREIALR